MLLLQEKGTATPKELLHESKDIPQTTLYRTLKSMENAEIIKVVAETKKRAVIEKSYAISEEFTNFENKIIDDNNGRTYYKMFHHFILELVKKFDIYSEKENIDITQDGSGFNAMSIYATSEELSDYSKEILEILKPAMERKNKNQKMHTLAMIITPPSDK